MTWLCCIHIPQSFLSVKDHEQFGQGQFFEYATLTEKKPVVL